MRKVPLTSVKEFDEENIPIINTILNQYGQSINDTAYGQMWANMPGATIIISGLGVSSYVSPLSATLCSGFTFQNDRELVCNNEGTYLLSWGLAVATTFSNETIEAYPGLNGVGLGDIASCHSAPPNPNKQVAMGGTGIIHLKRNEVISLMVENHDGTHNIILDHCSFTIIKIDD